MDEEETLEEELRKLDVKEDLGEEDSDTTPTNTPPPPAPPSLIQLPQSSNTSGFFDGDFTRYSLSDDYDARTDSSLSWGEDEFEGEATRIVTALFNQIDDLIYEDAFPKLVQFPCPKLQDRKNKAKSKKNKPPTTGKVALISPDICPDDPFLFREDSEDEAYDSASTRGLDIPPPSKSLIAECKEWVENFPHLRVTGVGINVLRYEFIERQLLDEMDCESSFEEEDYSEEIIQIDGDYENKLQFVTLKPEISKDKKKEKPKGPPSRICSGSADPDLLREHVLIKMFDHFWPFMSQIVEPLLNQFAKHLISHSVQCSSFSRGSSTLGYRELPQINTSHPSSIDLAPSVRWHGQKLLNSRPSSAANRLPSSVPNVTNEFSSFRNPMSSDREVEGRSRSASKMREYSNSSRSSLPSLPHLLNFQRPVSSRSGNHLLTPMPTVDQRPVSTSSHQRIRDKDNFNKLNKIITIEEGDVAWSKDDRKAKMSPPWSRHNSFSSSFLPKIDDAKPGSSTSRKSSLTSSEISKSLSARSRISQDGSQCSCKSSDAGPFVSWVVSRVDKLSRSVSPVEHVYTNKPIAKTKYFKRLFHH